MAERDRQPLIIQPDWLGRGLTQNELLVLARLDSYWRNGHRAHPSSEFLAQQIDLHPRTVERALRGLEEKEWIYRETQHRKSGSGGKLRILFPTDLVGTMGVPDKSDHYLLDNSGGYVSDNSVGIEKERESKRGRIGANGYGQKDLSCPEGVSPEVWADFLRHRKNIKAPLTATAWKRMEPELSALVAEGWSADDALAEVMAAGWRGLKAEWLRNRCQQQQQHNSPFAGAL